MAKAIHLLPVDSWELRISYEKCKEETTTQAGRNDDQIKNFKKISNVQEDLCPPFFLSLDFSTKIN